MAKAGNSQERLADGQEPFSAVPWQRWLWLSALVVVADQAAKQAILAYVPYGASYSIASFFNLVHVWNTGAAFSLLADAGGWQRYVFSVIGIVVAVFLVWMLWRGVPSRIEAAGYAGIMGGALGNVADRITRGFVVDYLDFHWRDWHWPAFNLADMAIASGAALIVLASLRPGGSKAGQSGTPAKRAGAR